MQTIHPVKSPRKQRKRLFNAPAHVRHKLMSAHLSAELAASRGIRSLPVRKGDTVRIMRGDHKGFEGKISRVDLKNYRVYLEGLTREKVDGTAIFLPIHPSKIAIKTLSLDDKWRRAVVEGKEELAKQREKEAAKKPKKKAVKAKEKPAKAEVEKPEKPAKKPVAKKAAEKKPAAKKKKEEKPVVEEKPVKKERKPRAAAKKITAKPKGAAEKKEEA